MICNVVGARPNYMKMAPIVKELDRRRISQRVVHTGQHYDSSMSAVFFADLGIAEPQVNLGVGAASHGEQMARILERFASYCEEEHPTIVVVAGDVNSTLACALAATKLNIPVVHVEAGLRSFDRSMPEELNRVLTDHIASLLLTTEASGNENLRREGIAGDHVVFVGNSMIDSLLLNREKALRAEPWSRLSLVRGQYGLATFHRPANVDEPDTLREIGQALYELGSELPLVFAVHPRTSRRLKECDVDLGDVRLLPALGYLEFLGLMAGARLVLTDSGGIQEETTALGVPCLTVRPNTERPVTIECGTNRLVPARSVDILSAAREAVKGAWRGAVVPPLWDGRAAPRIVDAIETFLESRAAAGTGA